jgi:hypothetical protein
MSVNATTRDVGLAVRDALEHLTHFFVYQEDEHGDPMEDGQVEIFDVDASDASNLVLRLTNGQQFTIHIVAR